MWTKQVTDMIIAGVGETLYMTLFSTFFGYVFGMPLGILLKVSDKEGLRPNAVLYKILDVIANIFRSIPFLILLIQDGRCVQDPGTYSPRHADSRLLAIPAS